jgi:CRISPR system Cascade subunit CasE
MYLSRLILNPRSRQVRRELADVHELHRTVCAAFPSEIFVENQSSGVLFRVEVHPRTGTPTLLVQSQHPPDWGFLSAPGKDYLLGADELPLEVENPAVKAVDVALQPGQTLAFRLRANPTKRLGKDAGEKHHQRVGLMREEEQLKWLKRKMEAAGASLVSVNTANETRAGGKLFRDDEKHTLSFVSVQFDGVLQVQDPSKLLETLRAGVGSGKGLGFGLLSLAPVRG